MDFANLSDHLLTALIVVGTWKGWDIIAAKLRNGHGNGNGNGNGFKQGDHDNLITVESAVADLKAAAARMEIVLARMEATLEWQSKSGRP